ncbi:hypothetical protein ACJIZ3_023940 [Penstemon smallii]|uniref:Uncharacterized protein n=1 Tax=Penstemon smallii TaxID=265156 RepID=A0ABD3TQG9_9LAMI
MRILPEPSGPLKWEWIYRYLMKTLGVDIFLFAIWFLFSVGLLPYDVLKRSCLPPHGKAQEHSLQDFFIRINGCSYFRHSNVEDINAFGESEWSDDGEADEDNDDSDASSEQGSDDSGGDEEEDDNGGEGKGNDGDDVDEDESDYTESSEEDGEDESLLSHARKVYTPNVFRAFEHEFRKSKARTVDFGSHYWDERRQMFHISKESTN